MHKVKIEGWIDSLCGSHMLVVCTNMEKVRNSLRVYGTVDFVPLLGKQFVKVKYGKLAKKFGPDHIEFLIGEIGKPILLECKVRKNSKAGTVSLSLLAESLRVTESTVTESELAKTATHLI
jgi:hypothetical protein